MAVITNADQADSANADPAHRQVQTLMSRARAAQTRFAGFDQAAVDRCVLAAGWAIMEPGRNRELAELAVSDTGLGNVPDKILKNHRKTLGLLRDLADARTVGVIRDDPLTGITEIARPVGVIAAITPSTNPGATPANKIINALKCRNAIIVAPSPKGWRTAERLISFVQDELVRVGTDPELARGLVQLLPAPVTKAGTHALMRAADLIVATGSQANIRAAYSSGTPAFGVGAGNVAAIVDASADPAAAAARIAVSKTFDNATSCSSENAVVILDAAYDATIAALQANGGVMLGSADKARLQDALWPAGRLSSTLIAQAADDIAQRAGLSAGSDAGTRFLMVSESGFGPQFPFSGEKLAPVLAVYRARDFDDAIRLVAGIYAYQGAGHSVGLHSAHESHARALAERLPVSRVIVNQAHCIATGGSFDNGLPFSLSMGCGTWGGNGFSENLNYRHYMNVTRIARVIPACEPGEGQIFGAYFDTHGR
ncbi:MAG: aldehyde dehydrogenase family protein [Burkholderiaceae bacterium]